jgi:hypothetical protein
MARMEPSNQSARSMMGLYFLGRPGSAQKALHKTLDGPMDL